jgi:hypothetical protein
MGHRGVATREFPPAIAGEKTSPSPPSAKGGRGGLKVIFKINIKNTPFPLDSQENWQAKESA